MQVFNSFQEMQAGATAGGAQSTMSVFNAVGSLKEALSVGDAVAGQLLELRTFVEKNRFDLQADKSVTGELQKRFNEVHKLANHLDQALAETRRGFFTDGTGGRQLTETFRLDDRSRAIKD